MAGLCQTGPGAERCRALRPCPRPGVAQRRLRRLSQLRALLEEHAAPGLAGMEEAEPLFGRLQVEGVFFLPPELALAAEFLAAAARAARFLDQAGPEMDELHRLRNLITPLPEVERRLRQVVGPGGSVASAASPQLARARRQVAKARESLRGRLGEMLQRGDLAGAFSDQVVTQRAERFVLPVRTDMKGRVAGIIHATSGSGATCFVEPLEAVEDNNRLALAIGAEREEEQRVLLEVTRLLARNRQVLHEDFDALAQLDCLLAQAAFAQRTDSLEPVLVSDGMVDLLGARHPLLAWRQARGEGAAVPIDLTLGGEQRALVISGANAGGKTAAIKTAGLVTLMAMCGMHVPCRSGSRVALFDSVWAEAGDDQDLGRDLSTFTAHAGRLAAMARGAGKGSLVLIDELGAGTDPAEGSALGMAVIEWLLARGALIVCTTHMTRLKAFAGETEGAANASVAFDQRTGRPTYQLAYGRPGFSDALAVSRGLGFPPELLAAAEARLDPSEREAAELLRRTQRDAEQARAQRDAARAEHLRASEDRRQARELLKKARSERRQALGEGKRRVREVARRMQERLDELLERVREQKQAGEKLVAGRVEQEMFALRRQALAEVDETLTPPEEKRAAAGELAGLKAGDPVRLVTLGQDGALLEDPGPDGQPVPVSVGVGGVRVLVAPEDMEPLPKGARPRTAQAKVSVRADAGDGLDLNVVGKTVDEALPLLDKYLDQAVLAGRASIKVVHGVGTGRLRNAVRDYLRHHPQVTSAGPQPGPGGSAVTVAELRE